jgi:rhodanese-related sulfurtransferase
MKENFIKMGFFSQGVKNFTAKEAYFLCNKGAILLDVREDYMNAFKQFKIENVIQIPFTNLNEEWQELTVNDYIICADSVGLRSIEAVKLLLSRGYQKVANLPGGIVDWENDGLPVETSKKDRLSGSCMCQLKPRERNRN